MAAVDKEQAFLYPCGPLGLGKSMVIGRSGVCRSGPCSLSLYSQGRGAPAAPSRAVVNGCRAAIGHDGRTNARGGNKLQLQINSLL